GEERLPLRLGRRVVAVDQEQQRWGGGLRQGGWGGAQLPGVGLEQTDQGGWTHLGGQGLAGLIRGAAPGAHSAPMGGPGSGSAADRARLFQTIQGFDEPFASWQAVVQWMGVSIFNPRPHLQLEGKTHHLHPQ
ncbi:MAG: hypothetical protein ACK559_22990, partial [bacterium]